MAKKGYITLDPEAWTISLDKVVINSTTKNFCNIVTANYFHLLGSNGETKPLVNYSTNLTKAVNFYSTGLWLK